MTLTLRYTREPLAREPTRATNGSAAFDLYNALPSSTMMLPGQRYGFPTGIAFEIPGGYFGLIAPRSGLAVKHRITLVNTPAIIDSDYRGPITIWLMHDGMHSVGGQAYTILPGERIAQIVFLPYAVPTLVEATSLTETDRGNGGFGSTGR